MNKRRWTGWVVLSVLLLLAAGAVALVDVMTQRPLDKQKLQQAKDGLVVLFPDADVGEGFAAVPLPENSPLDFACQVRREDTLLGYAAAATVQGYGGPIQVLVGAEPEGALRGIVVGGEGFAETAGIGSQVQQEAFTTQFAGKTPPLTLGAEVQTVAGATISSRAALNAVNLATDNLWQLVGMPVPPMETTPRAINASVLGYGGPVLVQLLLEDNGTIAAMQVGGARFSETEGIGSRVKEDAFTSQFISKTPPLALGEGIDAIAGATVSSQAVVDAVNTAATYIDRQ